MQKILRWVNLTLILLTFLAYLAPYVSPIAFWPLAFFGLMYPWLLLLNILFVIYWIIQKNKYAWFSVACILLGWGHFRSIVGLNSGRATISNQDNIVNITSFNAYGGKDFQSHTKIDPEEAVVAIFEQEMIPDILCLQEFIGIKALAKPYNDLFKKQGLQHATWKAEEELAIFTTYPILRSELKKFNNSNGYQYADLNIDGSTVRVFNIHLQSNAVSSLAERVATEGDFQQRETWQEIRGMAGRFKRAVQKRALQAEEIAAQIAQSPHPVIVCGDFNDIPQSYTYQTIARGLQDSFRKKGLGLGFTYLGRIPALRIDYILTSPTWQVQYFDQKRTFFSDHRVISTQLVLKEN